MRVIVVTKDTFIIRKYLLPEIHFLSQIRLCLETIIFKDIFSTILLFLADIFIFSITALLFICFYA